MRRSRTILNYLLIATVVFLILGCVTKPRSRNNAANAKLRATATEYFIEPQETDPKIDDWLEPHYIVVDSSIAAKNKLFLFFPGSYGKPARQRLINQEAAKLGYHAINLHYPNSATVASLCNRSRDPNCHEKLRQEIIDGVDRSPVVEISSANSIINRLTRVLVYLEQQQPEQGWGQYLENGNPKWDSIVVAGHSQGSGHAAMIAHQHEVARVVMLGGIADYSRFMRRISPWLSQPHATPAERFYGFVHSKDRGVNRILKAWELLGMSAYGEPVNIDQVQAPYNGSHQLITGAQPGAPRKYHGSVATDHSTPMNTDGTPRFAAAWRYLLDF